LLRGLGERGGGREAGELREAFLREEERVRMFG